MIKKIKNVIMAAILPLAMAAPLAVVAPTASVLAVCSSTQQGIAKGVEGATGGSSAVGSGSNCNVGAAGGPSSIYDVAKTVVDFLSVLIGIIAVIMIIFAGFRYITSGGDSGNVSNAKNTLIYAIVGLIIVALAQFIVRFVLGAVDGTVSA